MIKIEPTETRKYFEHLLKFKEPGYFDNLTATAATFWGSVRSLRAHPASIKLFLDSFVESLPASVNLRDNLKKRLFMQNEFVHDLAVSRIYHDSSVLDLGAGIGCLKDMLDAHGRVGEYHAHDISEGLLRLNPADDGKKYCCDFRDLPQMLWGMKFDFVVDCSATHNLSYNPSAHEELLQKLAPLAKFAYIYHGVSEPKVDRKKIKNIVVI